MKQGRYKLAKAVDGVCHFAQVGLILDTNFKPSCSTPLNPLIDTSELDKSWIDAAVAGAEAAINTVALSPKYYLVEVSELTGVVCDTNDNAVWCASALAALSAMDINNANLLYDEVKKEFYIDLSDKGMIHMI